MTALLDPTAPEPLDVLGPTIQILARADSDEGPCVMRGVIPPGAAVPLHAHPDPETFVALSGAVDGWADGRWVPIAPGAIFHVPPGARHAFRNDGREPAVTLVVSTSRLARFFEEIGVPAAHAVSPPTETRLAHLLAVARRYGHWNGTPEENAAIGLRL